ncbi:fap1 adhesin-like [Palaemon carinicauda]|uniref:fap1 adhesin-like n=1 Tax=Palaemon carinicauda TaxID=392227 RepID=UPI0035B5A055
MADPSPSYRKCVKGCKTQLPKASVDPHTICIKCWGKIYIFEDRCQECFELSESEWLAYERYSRKLERDRVRRSSSQSKDLSFSNIIEPNSSPVMVDPEPNSVQSEPTMKDMMTTIQALGLRVESLAADRNQLMSDINQLKSGTVILKVLLMCSVMWRVRLRNLVVHLALDLFQAPEPMGEVKSSGEREREASSLSQTCPRAFLLSQCHRSLTFTMGKTESELIPEFGVTVHGPPLPSDWIPSPDNVERYASDEEGEFAMEVSTPVSSKTMDSFHKQLVEVTPRTALRSDLLILDPQETPALLSRQHRSLRSRGKERDKEILKRLSQGKTKKPESEQKKSRKDIEKMSLSMLESNISNIKGLDQTYANISTSEDSTLSESIDLRAVTKFHRMKNRPRRGLALIAESKSPIIGKRKSLGLSQKEEVSVLKDQTYANITDNEDTSGNDSLNQEALEKLEKLRSRHRKALSKGNLTTKEWVVSSKRVQSKKDVVESLPSPYKNVRRSRSIVVADDTYRDLSSIDTSSDSISLEKVKVLGTKRSRQQRRAMPKDLSILANKETETDTLQSMSSNATFPCKSSEASARKESSDFVMPSIESSAESQDGSLSDASTYLSPVKDQNENDTEELLSASHRKGFEKEREESYSLSTMESSLGSIQSPKKLKLSQKAPPIQLNFSSIWSKLKDKSALETHVEEEEHEEGRKGVRNLDNTISGLPELKEAQVVLHRLEESDDIQLSLYKSEKPLTPPQSFRDGDQSNVIKEVEDHNQCKGEDDVVSKDSMSETTGFYVPEFSSDNSSDSEVSSNISAALGTLYNDGNFPLKRKSVSKVTSQGLSFSSDHGTLEKRINNSLEEKDVRSSMMGRSPGRKTHDLQEKNTQRILRSSPLKKVAQESSKNTFQKGSAQSPEKGNQQKVEKVPSELVISQKESYLIKEPSPLKNTRNSSAGVSPEKRTSNSPGKRIHLKRANDFPKETSPHKKMRLSQGKVSPEKTGSGSPKEISISPRKDSSQKGYRVSPMKASPQLRRSVSPRKLSPQLRMSVSPGKLGPQLRMSVSPRKSSSQLRTSVSPRKISTQLRRSVSPRKVSPLKRMSISPRNVSPPQKISILPERVIPQRRLSVTPKKSSPSKEISISSEKTATRRKMSVTPNKSSSSEEISVSSKKTTSQRCLSVTPNKFSPSKEVRVIKEKITPQRMRSVTPNKSSSSKKMSISSKETMPRKRMSVTPHKSSSREKVSDLSKEISPQIKLIDSSMKVSPRKRSRNLPEKYSTHITSPKKASPQKRKENSSLQEVSSFSRTRNSSNEDSPFRKLRSSPNKGNENKLVVAVRGDSVLENEGLDMPSNPECPSLDSFGLEKDTLKSSENIGEPLVRRSLLEQFTDTSFRLNLSDNISRNEGLEMEGKHEIPSSEQINLQKDTMDSLEKTNVESKEESPKRKSFHKSFSSISMKSDVSENRLKTPQNMNEITVSSERRSSSRRKIPKKFFVTDDVTYSDKGVSKRKGGKDGVKRKSSESIALKRKSSDASSGYEVSFLGDKNKQGSEKRRRSQQKRRRSSSRDDERGLKSIVHEVQVHPEEAIKAMRKSNYLLGDQREKEDFVAEFPMELQEEDVGQIRGDSESKRKIETSGNISVLMQKEVEDLKESVLITDISDAVIVETGENKVETDEDAISDHEYVEGILTTKSVEVEKDKDQREEYIDTRTSEVQKENDEDSIHSNDLVMNDDYVDGRSTTEWHKFQKKDRIVSRDGSNADVTTTEKICHTEDMGINTRKRGSDTSSESFHGIHYRRNDADSLVVHESPLDTKTAPLSPGIMTQGEEGGIDDGGKLLRKPDDLASSSSENDRSLSGEEIGENLPSPISEKAVEASGLVDVSDESSTARSSYSKEQKSDPYVNDDRIPNITSANSISTIEVDPQIVKPKNIDLLSSQDDSEPSGSLVGKYVVNTEVDGSNNDEALAIKLIPISVKRSNAKSSFQKKNITTQDEKFTSYGENTNEEIGAVSISSKASEAPKLIQMTMTSFLKKLVASPPKPSAVYNVKESKDFMEAMYRSVASKKVTKIPIKKQAPGVDLKIKKDKLPLSVPEILTKEIFEHYAKCKVDKNALKTIVQVSEKFWGNCTEDLMSIATSRGKGNSIKREDVVRLMTREGTLNESTPLTSLVVDYLPSEEWDILIPTEYGNNRVYPPPKN